MVEQEVLDLLADAAPPEPEKVQVVARLPISGVGVGGIWPATGVGGATPGWVGAAEAKADKAPKRR